MILSEKSENTFKFFDSISEKILSKKVDLFSNNLIVSPATINLTKADFCTKLSKTASKIVHSTPEKGSKMLEERIPKKQAKAYLEEHPETPNVIQTPQFSKDLSPDDYFYRYTIDSKYLKKSKNNFWISCGAGTYNAKSSSIGGIVFNSLFFWPISFIYYSRIFVPPIISLPAVIFGLWEAFQDSDGFQYGYLAMGFLSLFVSIFAFFVSLGANSSTDKKYIANWAEKRDIEVSKYFNPGKSDDQ